MPPDGLGPGDADERAKLFGERKVDLLECALRKSEVFACPGRNRSQVRFDRGYDIHITDHCDGFHLAFPRDVPPRHAD